MHYLHICCPKTPFPPKISISQSSNITKTFISKYQLSFERKKSTKYSVSSRIRPRVWFHSVSLRVMFTQFLPRFVRWFQRDIDSPTSFFFLLATFLLLSCDLRLSCDLLATFLRLSCEFLATCDFLATFLLLSCDFLAT